MPSEALESLFSLKGRSAVITGGTGGIGSMIARGFLLAGARVYITGRSQKAATEMAAHLSQYGECYAIVGELDDQEKRETLAAAITAEVPDLSILVNNSGVTGNESFGACTDKTMDAVHELNFKAGFLLIQALHPLLKASASRDRPSHIINIGSSGGIATHMPASYAYCPGKAAVHHLTKGLARELAPDHINVNAIAPGVFPTKMAAQITEDEVVAAQIIQMVPAGRWGEPDDMSALAVFIASNRYLVGEIIALDGGLVL